MGNNRTTYFADGEVPANMKALHKVEVPDESPAWPVGDFVTLGNFNKAHWNGSKWARGESPGYPSPIIEGDVQPTESLNMPTESVESEWERVQKHLRTRR